MSVNLIYVEGCLVLGLGNLFTFPGFIYEYYFYHSRYLYILIWALEGYLSIEGVVEMVEYSYERDLFSKENIKILYYNETELGEEYIIQDGNKFIKVLYDKMKLVSASNVTVDELFSCLSRGLKFAKLVCRFIKLEIFIIMVFTALIGLDFSLSRLHDVVVSNWLWLALGMLIIPRNKYYVLEISRIIISSVYMINVFSGVIEIFNYGIFIKVFSMVLCFVYIILNAFIYNICENESQLYNDIKSEYF